MAVLVAGFGGFALLSVMQLGSLKRDLREREQRVALLSAETDTLKQQLSDVELARQGLESRLSDMRIQMTSASNEREQLRSAVSELRLQADALASEKNRLESQASRLTQERDAATTRLESLESENVVLSDSAVKLRNRLTLLDRDYQSLQEDIVALRSAPPASSAAAASPVKVSGRAMGVLSEPVTPVGSWPAAAPPVVASMPRDSIELPPIVVRKGHAEAMRSIRSRVVDANEEHGFVVLDKGSDDGIQSGMAFEILRGDQAVGQVTAIRVRSRLSACALVGSRSSSFPKVGDSAIQYVP
jgi:hypothetical protein